MPKIPAPRKTSQCSSVWTIFVINWLLGAVLSGCSSEPTVIAHFRASRHLIAEEYKEEKRYYQLIDPSKEEATKRYGFDREHKLANKHKYDDVQRHNPKACLAWAKREGTWRAVRHNGVELIGGDQSPHKVVIKEVWHGYRNGDGFPAGGRAWVQFPTSPHIHMLDENCKTLTKKHNFTWVMRRNHRDYDLPWPWVGVSKEKFGVEKARFGLFNEQTAKLVTKMVYDTIDVKPDGTLILSGPGTDTLSVQTVGKIEKVPPK